MDFGLRDWARREPGRIAAKAGDAIVTYGELEATANRIAHLFRSLGLRRGDHVAASVANDPVIFALAWAAYRAGLYFTPVSSAASARDAGYVIENSKARFALVDSTLQAASSVQAEVGSAPHWFSLGGKLAGMTELHDALAAQPDTPIPDETPGGLMLYTSGTTGAPKGVWRPLPTDGSGPPPFAGELLRLYGIDSDTRYLSTAPLYHAAPLRFSLATIAAGGVVHLMRKFDAEAALDILEREGVTHSQWVPSMFQRLLSLPEERRGRHRAPHHRLALHSAAPCPIPVKRAMIAWWGPIIQEYYAGSESIGTCTITSAEWLERPTSVGRSVRGTLHILGDDWSELPAGQIGRIYFSGVPPFEYFDAPEKTRDRTSPQGYQTIGDIGYVDAEGFLYIVDRQDDMIISGGVNIYPQELEAALIEHLQVVDCAVVGMPDPAFGEIAVAFEVPRTRVQDDSTLVSELDLYCRERLGSVKRPKEIRIVTELPRTPTGKLLRRMLRA